MAKTKTETVMSINRFSWDDDVQQMFLCARTYKINKFFLKRFKLFVCTPDKIKEK